MTAKTSNLGLSYQMQIKWSYKTTEWFQRASAYTGFHKKLAEVLLEHLKDTKTLCDFGCGGGMIDLELCDRIPEITCIDREPVVVHLLEKEVREREIKNIHVRCEDLLQTEGRWDAGIMLFVDNDIRYIPHLLGLVNDRLLMVHRGGCINNPLVGERAKQEHSLLPMINNLFREGIRCSVSAYSFEYGQPFRNLDEAEEYVLLYHKNRCNENIRDYISQHVVRTEDTQYPYYMPYQKNFGIFEIRRKDNLHLLKTV